MKKYIMEVTEKVLKTEEEIAAESKRREYAYSGSGMVSVDEYRVTRVITIELTEAQMNSVKAAAIEAI